MGLFDLLKRNKSDADVTRSALDEARDPGENPGAITAAMFLRPFAGGLPWAHLDIAGPARASEDDGILTKGATAFGVRLLHRWLAGT